MNIDKKLIIRPNPRRWAFPSLIVLVFLLVACGDATLTTIPGLALAGSAVTTAGNSTTGAMMGQTPGAMMGNNTPGTGRVLSVSEAKEAVTSYLNQLGNKDLAIDEIMIFDNNAYVAIKDGKTGSGAFELLVNPVNKAVFPEFGPNMMWNLSYGYMSGKGANGMMGQQMNQIMGTAPNGIVNQQMGQMMGNNGTNNMMGSTATNGMMGGIGLVNTEVIQTGKMPVSAGQALKVAQVYLDKAYPGVQVGTKADEYPGYYTIDVQKQGKLSGMLSVNGFTGQVWYHTWHGQFIEMTDFGK